MKKRKLVITSRKDGMFFGVTDSLMLDLMVSGMKKKGYNSKITKKGIIFYYPKRKRVR